MRSRICANAVATAGASGRTETAETVVGDFMECGADEDATEAEAADFVACVVAEREAAAAASFAE